MKTKCSNNQVLWVKEFNGRPASHRAVTIFPHKSRVSLNPLFGCDLGCKYCICQNDSTSASTIRQVSTVTETITAFESVLDEIKNYIIHPMDFTEPLEKNCAITLELLRGLAQLNFTAPVILTSKAGPPLSVLKEIKSLGLNILIFSSIADTSGLIEPQPVSLRERLIRNSSIAGIPVFLALKPIHNSYTNVKRLTPVIARNARYMTGIVITGLRAPATIRRKMSRQGIDINNEGAGNLLLPDANLEGNLIRVINNIAPQLKVYPRRKCAIYETCDIDCQPKDPSLKWPDIVAYQSTSTLKCGIVLRRNAEGYCCLAQAQNGSTRFTKAQALALETLSLLFNRNKISWCVAGSASRVVTGQVDSGIMSDVDVNIHYNHYNRAIEILSKSTKTNVVSCLGCDDPRRCGNGNNALGYEVQDDPEITVNKTQQLLVTQAQIGSIKIDLAPSKTRLNPIHIPIGSFLVPFLIKDAA